MYDHRASHDEFFNLLVMHLLDFMPKLDTYTIYNILTHSHIRKKRRRMYLLKVVMWSDILPTLKKI